MRGYREPLWLDSLRLGRTMLDDAGLFGWRLGYTDEVPYWAAITVAPWVRRNVGQSIIVSRPLLAVAPEMADEFMVHEVAHVFDLTAHGSSGHGPAWRGIAIRLGSSGAAYVPKPLERFINEFHTLDMSQSNTPERWNALFPEEVNHND